MKKSKKNYFCAIVLLVCTMIGAYGIWKAPDSDEAEMKQELQQHEQALQHEDSATSSALSNTESQNTASPKREQNKKEQKLAETITVIGDSVFLGAAPAFQKVQKNVVVDAKISRQVRHGIDVAKKLQKKEKLGDTVIISLGTNGVFNPVTGQEFIDYLGAKRTIYWINAYGKNLEFQEDVNKTIQELAEKNSNVHLIAWDKEAKKHPGWFYQDGTHLNPKGQDGFSQFIKEQIEGN